MTIFTTYKIVWADAESNKEKEVILMPKCFCVVENTPSCFPVGDPVYFKYKKDAQNYAQELANELRNLGYHVRGNKQSGYYAERYKNDLGRVILVIEETKSQHLETNCDFI